MRILHITFSALVLCLAACGGSSPEAVAEEQADVMNDFADVIEGIQSADDLEDAKPAMRKLGERMKEISQRWEAMAADGFSEAEYEGMVKDNKEIAEATTRFSSAMMKMAMNPQLQPHMNELMQEFGDVFEPN